MSVPFHSGLPIPMEILENVTYELVAHTPLGVPSQIIPLLLTSRAIHGALSLNSGTLLYSRICRLKFDIGAVTRRAFTPRVKDLNSHLVQMCTTLQVIRRGDINHEDSSDEMLNVYIAMLGNDGKNRAQLEHAGVVDFLDRFVRAKLHEGRENNNMWPLDGTTNACALWLMWMFTTRERLLEETPERRQEFARLIFPYLAAPHRYPAAIVPPNHFTLPLGVNNPVQKDLFTMQTAHGYFPNYHTNKANTNVLYYFRSNAPIIDPLLVPAAYLLDWSRRELNGYFEVPLVLAPTRTPGQAGLTQQDIREYNAHKCAKIPAAVLWDWERGMPICTAEDGSMSPCHEDDSQRWDVDWWRARLCDSAFYKQPKFRLGAVYVRGMLTGLWQGVSHQQSLGVFNSTLERTQFPSNLTETTASFGGRPLFLRLKEHGFVRTPAHADTTPIPHGPPGRMDISITSNDTSRDAVVPIDVSIKNAWFPGLTGSVRWVDNSPSLDPGVLQDRIQASRLTASGQQPMSSTKFIIAERSHPSADHPEFAAQSGGPVESGSLFGLGSAKTYTYEAYDPSKESVHRRMLDAKERLEFCVVGHAISQPSPSTSPPAMPRLHPGCLQCVEREEFLRNRKMKDTTRRFSEHVIDEMFASVGIGKPSGSMFDIGDGDTNDTLGDADRQREVIDLQLDSDDSEDEQEHLVDDHTWDRDGPRVSRLVPVTSSPPSPDSSEDSDAYSEDDEDDDLAIDHEQGLPGLRHPDGGVEIEATRRSHDRYRVEQCDDGVEDVVVTGDMDEHHRLAWGPSIFYGRVRPWDGMIAILRIFTDRNASPNTHQIFYGYIYGGDTFVGNWRYAVADPFVPSFEAGFIMSKRPE